MKWLAPQFEKAGFILLANWEWGFRNVTNNKKPIMKPEDLKGLKMRIPGLGGKVLAKAGGNAILVAGGEIYTNLDRGVIDATEWVGPYHDLKMGFYKVAKYYYYPGWHEPGTTLEAMVNIGAYEKGRSPQVDRAVQLNKPLAEFLRQDRTESSSFDETLARLIQLVGLGVKR